MIAKTIKKNAIFTFISICLIIAGLAAAITFMPVTTYAMVQDELPNETEQGNSVSFSPSSAKN